MHDSHLTPIYLYNKIKKEKTITTKATVFPFMHAPIILTMAFHNFIRTCILKTYINGAIKMNNLVLNKLRENSNSNPNKNSFLLIFVIL
jgi:hypothetical protein